MSSLQVNDDFLTQALAQYQWSDYHTQTNSAQHIPSALWGLFHATSADIDQFYWQIENHVVAQGEIYSAAEPTLAVLLEVISHNTQNIASYALTGALELIYQIVAGATYTYSNDSQAQFKQELLAQARAYRTALEDILRVPPHCSGATEILALLS